MKPTGGATDFEAVESQFSHDKKADKKAHIAAESAESGESQVSHDKIAETAADAGNTEGATDNTEGATGNTQGATGNTQGATGNTGGSIERIELSPSVGAALGISIKGGLDHPFLVNKEDKAIDSGIFVVHVYSGGVAATDGRLRLGDRILAVNGVKVEKVRQKDFLKILNGGSKEGGKLELTVKHHEALRKRLSSRKATLPPPPPPLIEVGGGTKDAASAVESGKAASLNGVQMLTGFANCHFEPLEVCASPSEGASGRIRKGECRIEETLTKAHRPSKEGEGSGTHLPGVRGTCGAPEGKGENVGDAQEAKGVDAHKAKREGVCDAQEAKREGVCDAREAKGVDVGDAQEAKQSVCDAQEAKGYTLLSTGVVLAAIGLVAILLIKKQRQN